MRREDVTPVREARNSKDLSQHPGLESRGAGEWQGSLDGRKLEGPVEKLVYIWTQRMSRSYYGMLLRYMVCLKMCVPHVMRNTYKQTM